MKSERLFTIIMGLCYIVLLSLPRWNYDLLFAGEIGHFKILQPIIHIILFILLIKRIKLSRIIIIILLGVSVSGSITIMSYEAYPGIIIYGLLCLTLGIIFTFSTKIKKYMNSNFSAV